MIGVIGMSPEPGPLGRWLWRHPEWWVILVSLCAWLVMIPHMVKPAECSCCSSPGGEFVGWIAMAAAMMLPFLAETIQSIAARSFPGRRASGVAIFVLGYLAAWAAFAPIHALWRSTPWGYHELGPTVAFAAAAAWCMTPTWRIAHQRSHAFRSFAATGPRWWSDLVGYGVRCGIWSMVACLPLMIGCALTGHAAFAMLGGLGIGLIESRSRIIPQRTLAACCVVLAVASLWL